MSSARSRSGGTRIGNTLSRKKRSERNLPSRTASSRSRFVAAITRASVRSVSLPPTRSNSRSCSTRSRATCTGAGSSPTSSRKIVPPAASSKRPRRRSSAPVKAPFSWPNSSEATSPSGSAAQLTLTRARLARGDPWWIARAMSSLPVPVSPVISTVESVAATRETRSSTSRSPGEAPMIPPAAAVAAISSWRARFSSSSWDRSFWISSKARAFATAVVTGRATSSRIRTSSGENGDRVVRANTIAATNDLVHGQRQHDRALGARTRHRGRRPAALSFLMSLKTSVCRSSLDGVAHHGDRARTCLPWHRSLSEIRRTYASVALARSPRDRCGGSPREPGAPARSWMTTRDQVDRHEPLERARHRCQHARQVALRVRRLRHGQERLVLRLPRPPSIHTIALRNPSPGPDATGGAVPPLRPVLPREGGPLRSRPPPGAVTTTHPPPLGVEYWSKRPRSSWRQTTTTPTACGW